MKVSGSEEALGLRLRLQGIGTATWRLGGAGSVLDDFG